MQLEKDLRAIDAKRREWGDRPRSPMRHLGFVPGSNRAEFAIEFANEGDAVFAELARR